MEMGMGRREEGIGLLDDRSRYPFPRIRLLSTTRRDCFPSISYLLVDSFRRDPSVHNLIDRVTGFFISLDRLSLMQRRLSYG